MKIILEIDESDDAISNITQHISQLPCQVE
jgi:hypothetical protein